MEEEKKKKKENSTELQRSNAEAEVYNNNRKFDWMCTDTYTLLSKIKAVQKNKVQQIDPANKGNKKLYLPVKNKTNLSTNWKTKLKPGAKWGIKQWK